MSCTEQGVSNPGDGGATTAVFWKPRTAQHWGWLGASGQWGAAAKHQATAAKSAEVTAEAEGQDKGSGVGLAPLSTALPSATPSAETKQSPLPSGERLHSCYTSDTENMNYLNINPWNLKK